MGSKPTQERKHHTDQHGSILIPILIFIFCIRIHIIIICIVFIILEI
ncbi:hypothetical protein XaFJ1_GM001520 [Xanthomonas albilineans]|nr:hypothetical protein XaFJ1_GM001520 [Xanthomonas albilineans]